MNFNTKINIVIPSGLSITFHPEQKVLSYFFHSVDRALYPKLISNVAESEGFSIQNAILQFYHEMDWVDKNELGAQPEDVSVYVYDGKPNEVLLKEILFSKVLYEYGVELLEEYGADDAWTVELEQALVKLRKKIAKSNP